MSLDASLNLLQFSRRFEECHMSRLDAIQDLLFAHRRIMLHMKTSCVHVWFLKIMMCQIKNLIDHLDFQ